MFKQGDKVRVKAGKGTHRLPVGSEWTIKRSDEVIVDLEPKDGVPGTRLEGWFANRFELIQAPEQGAIIGAPQPLTQYNAKVGMKVVLVRAQGHGNLEPEDVGQTFTVTAVLLDHVKLAEKKPTSNFYFDRFTVTPEPQVLGPGTKMRCIEGHRVSGLRKDKIVTIKIVGKTTYYTEEFPGLGFAKRRFEFLEAAAPVAAPKPLKEGDTCYVVKRMLSNEYWRDSFDEAMEHGTPIRITYAYGDLWYVDLNGGVYIPKAAVARELPPGFKAPPPFNGDIREELLKKVERKGAAVGNVTSFAYVADGGRPQYHINPACYAPLRYAKKIEQLVVSTVGHRKNLDDVQLATCRIYFDYLLNRSPWSPCFITKDVEEALSKGVVMNCDRPIGEVVGAAITIREATEFQGRLPMFQWAIDNGLSGDVGYIYGYFVVKKGADNFSMGDGAAGHSAFTGHHTMHDVESFFKNGFPDQGNPPARAGSQQYAIDASIRTGKAPRTTLSTYMNKVEKVTVGEGFYKSLVITSESLIKLGKALEQLFTKEEK